MSKNREYLWGLILIIFGAAGIAEHVTSGRGSFPFSAVIFGIGFVLIVWSYLK